MRSRIDESRRPHVTRDVWPSLRISQWQETRDALHLWTQVVGKIRLASAPMVNHWWQVPLYVSPRGLTTGFVPYLTTGFEIELDFIRHVVRIDATTGETRSIPMESMSVAMFYDRVMAAMHHLGYGFRLNTMPNEIAGAVRFEEDKARRHYDPDYARRFWEALVQAHRVLNDFRAGFTGKVSPVHFFWGSFDLAVTRFSGRTAPRHPGGIPNLPDPVTREAYSHEVSSAGWWPGDSAHEAFFYSYAYPTPDHFKDAKVTPPEAWFDETFGEFILPYDDVRLARDPDAEVAGFLQSTFAAAAANWPSQSDHRSI